ncbi:enoyl-CoA hydratase [Sneathiella chinensis]|uniref:Enoyl-CoA hydratase domain-containing protein 3, mitochondrial n=2 Tax=Sneathiella chinensis TaxID=349750 RepID=A0ABQ5U8X2_9PROT|nr:enoyl-CoA hydratase [Sneathiella chinensis]
MKEQDMPHRQDTGGERLRVTTQEGVATLCLTDASSRNALSSAMMTDITNALTALADRRDIHVVVIEAEGPAFSSGHNLKEVIGDSRLDTMQALFDQCSHMMQTVVNLPKPVIAKVDGVATAAGCQLVASCDLAFASDTSRFGTPGVNIGLFCSTPMVALSRNVAPKHAMEMLLGGDLVDAEHAARIGLINRAVPAADLAGTVAEFARRIAAKSPLTVSIGKTAFYQQLSLPLDQAYDLASRVMAENMQTQDAKEGISAFLEKRDPTWQGK